MKGQALIGKDNISVINYLKKAKQACDFSRLHESGNVWLSRDIMCGLPLPILRRSFYRGSKRTRTITSYTGVLIGLLRLYSTEEVSCKAYEDLRNCKQCFLPKPNSFQKL